MTQSLSFGVKRFRIWLVLERVTYKRNFCVVLAVCHGHEGLITCIYITYIIKQNICTAFVT